MEQQQIIDAVSALIGQPFTPVRGQFGVRSKTAAVEELIASYPSQMQSIRENIAKAFDELTAGDIPKHIAATQMYLLQPFTKVGSSGAHGMTPEQAIEIGRIIERKTPDPVRVMYHAILGREPDDAGYAFWNGHYQDGIPLSELCRYMEREKAAGAT